MIQNLIREGIVSEVNAEHHSCRVTYPDRNNLVSAELPVLGIGAFGNCSYALPDVDDRVVVLMCSNSLGGHEGFIIGSLYTSENLPEEANADLTKMTFKDNTEFRYKRSTDDDSKAEFHFKFNDDTKLSYENDDDSHEFTFKFNDDTKINYKNDDDSHEFNFNFNDDTSIKYKNDEDNHEFNFKFNDDTSIKYKNDEDNHEFNFKFNDNTEISYKNGEENATFKIKFSDDTEILYETGEETSTFHIKFSDGCEISYEFGDDATYTMKFSDGSTIEHTDDGLEVDIKGDINITAGGDINMRGSNINLN